MRCAVGAQKEFFAPRHCGAAQRAPVFVRSAESDPLVKSRFLRQAGIKALYGVPLMDGTEVLGVAHMGSLTAYEFLDEDMLAFPRNAPREAGGYDDVFQAWRVASILEVHSNGRADMRRDALRLALSAEWPSQIESNSTGRRIVISPSTRAIATRIVSRRQRAVRAPARH